MATLDPLMLSNVFPDLQIPNRAAALRFRLQQLSRTEMLRYCAHLNLFVSSPSDPQSNLAQQNALIGDLWDGSLFCDIGERYLRLR